MSKREIAKRVALEADVSVVEATKIVERVLDGIVAAIATDGGIELRNFGVFDVVMRKGRISRNPRTGERVEVPPKPRVRFYPGKEMHERLSRLRTRSAVLETACAEA